MAIAKSGEAYFLVHSWAVLKYVSGAVNISWAIGFTRGSAIELKEMKKEIPGFGSESNCIIVNKTLLIVKAADQLFLIVSKQITPFELILQW